MPKNNQKTKEQFVKNAVEKHGDKYDYSITKYKNCKEEIEIICKVHGVFKTTPDNFLQKRGCVKCTKDLNLKKLLESFIEKSKKIHNDKYDYSLVSIKSIHEKVKIICPSHGVFEQRPSNHLQKNGCNKCNIQNKANLEKRREEFIEKSNIIHQYKYTYDNCLYKTVLDKVVITCPMHGDYSIFPSKHLSGSGCNICKKEEDYNKNKDRKTSDFIQKAKIIHGDTYDYSLVEYIHSREKIKIFCKIHGVFEQKPVNHLKSCGCKACALLINIYKREDYIKLAEKATLYLIRIFKGNEEFYKIGKTKDSVKKRFSNTNIKPYDYQIVHTYESDSGSIFDLEIELHKKYHLYKYNPKYKFSGHGECYTLFLPTEEIINL